MYYYIHILYKLLVSSPDAYYSARAMRRRLKVLSSHLQETFCNLFNFLVNVFHKTRAKISERLIEALNLFGTWKRGRIVCIVPYGTVNFLRVPLSLTPLTNVKNVF